MTLHSYVAIRQIHHILILLLLIGTKGLTAQTFEQQYKTAIDLRLKKDFIKSDSVFKILFKKHKKNLPEELCYHYGVVLYELKDKNKSKSFLNKYLSFSQNNFKYKDSAIFYLESMNVVVTSKPKTISRIDTCGLCHGKGVSTQSCKKCSGSGKVICYQCKGTGVIGSSTEMGNSKFNSCHVCHGDGSLICTICKGEKSVVDKCPKCEGTGKIIIYK